MHNPPHSPDTPVNPSPIESDEEAQSVRARFTIDRVMVSGTDPRAREQVAQLTRHHERLLQRADDDAVTQDLRDVEFIASQLADREMQVGDPVPTAHGHFTVTRTFVGGGAYIAMLRDDARIQPAKLVCRGTAFRGSATEGYSSGANNVLFEMGARGVQTLWPGILEHVRTEGIRKIEIMGKSMGGACAQHLTILLECIAQVKVTRLVTDCSVGVGAAINKLFVERVLARRDEPFRMLVVRNGGNRDERSVDYVPTLGGDHLGVGTTPEQCEIDLCYMAVDDDTITFPRHGSMANMARHFFGSFWNKHCRQNTLGDVVHRVFIARQDVDTHLTMGQWLEPWRRRIASSVNWGWKRFNPAPLADYLEECTRKDP